MGVLIRGGWTVERSHISHKCSFSSRAIMVDLGYNKDQVMCNSCNEVMDATLLAIATIAQNEINNMPGYEAKPVPEPKKRSISYKIMRPWNPDAFNARNE